MVRKSLQVYGQIVWMYSFCFVLKYEGNLPIRRKNQIFVANHTSLIDFIVLAPQVLFATVGQKHGGFVGFLQEHLIGPLKNIWFERLESRDRRLVQDKMMEHIADETNPPLLIFPEGVCVNNEYCVMFKQGAFQPSVEICPIAIKYNKLFSDAYWSSRDESFIIHLFRLMKSWCTVCEVCFLEPQKMQNGESSVEFANRVKKMICKKANLVNLSWDGMIKYYQPSEKLKQEKQKIYADRIKKIE